MIRADFFMPPAYRTKRVWRGRALKSPNSADFEDFDSTYFAKYVDVPSTKSGIRSMLKPCPCVYPVIMTASILLCTTDV